MTMGIFNGRRRVSFEIPREQYDVLMVLFEAADKENPNWDADEWFSSVIGDWLDEHWRGVVKGMSKKKRRRSQSGHK